MALLKLLHQPEAVPDAGPERHLRRCTYRRLIAVERGPRPVYDVECLYPDRTVSLPLGDLESAGSICDACTAGHIFRPDED